VGHPRTGMPGQRAIAAGACCAGVPGSSNPASCVPPAATSTVLPAGAATSDFAPPGRIELLILWSLTS
jgi:hypothetical protein